MTAQQPLLMTATPDTSKWLPPVSFPRLWEAKSVTIDTETRDPRLDTWGPAWHKKESDAYMVGVSVEADGWVGYYPLAHANGNNMDNKIVLRWLSKVLKADNEKVFHNASYDLGWLSHSGLTQIGGTIFDTAAAAPLLDEHRLSYSLENLCQDFLGQGKVETWLQQRARELGLDPKADLWQLPPQDVGMYAEGDVIQTRALAEHLRPLLAEQNLTDLMSLECRLIPGLVRTRLKGVCVDVEAAERLRLKLGKDAEKLAHEHRKEFGKYTNPNSNVEIAAVCHRLGISHPYTKEGNPSFVKEWLESHKHPLFKSIRMMRQLATMRGLLKSIVYDYNYNGRIHCSLNQLRGDKEGSIKGTVSGRFSSSHPNLQQVPERDPFWGPLFRSLFIPSKGKRWISADYAEQEYRLIVHFALLLRLPGAKEAAAAYRVAGASFHQMVADLLGRPKERKLCKQLNFGMAYGMGEGLLAASLALTLEAARPLLTLYHDKAPFIRDLRDACSNRAEAAGYVHTILKRRCRFPLWERRTYGKGQDEVYEAPLPREEALKKWGNRVRRAWLHKAMNRVIQGGGADITKASMAACYDAGIDPLLQVHDELDFESDSPDESDKVKEIMQDTVPTDPHMVVDVGIGDNWAEAH